MKMMTRAEKEGVCERERGKGREKKNIDSTDKKKLAQRVKLFVWSMFQDGSNETRENACTWRHLHFERERSHSGAPLDHERLQGASMPASLGVPLELDRSFVF